MFRIASLLAFIGAVSAKASSVIQAELPELTATSDVVARGKVKRVHSYWTSDKRRIVTDVEIEVAETLKGAPGATIVVQQPGGVVGDIGQKVAGLASFDPNEEVVVFLEKHGSKYAVTGLSQGKYRVERSSDGKKVFAIPAATEAMLIDRDTHQPVEPRVQPVPLDELRSRVRETVRSQSGQRTP